MAKKLFRAFGAILGFGTVFQLSGCLSSGFAREVLIDQALDLLTGNNTILDLLTESVS